MRRPRAYKAKPTPPSDKPLHQPRAKSLEIGLTEAHVQQTVTQFLALDGWRVFKMEANSESGFVNRVRAKIINHPLLNGLVEVIMRVMRSCMRAAGVGEVGMPDYLYVRYRFPSHHYQELAHAAPRLETAFRSDAQLLWIEFKAPGKAAKPHQLAWHDAERKRGALVLVVDDIDDFMKRWYPQSGLQRR